MGQTVYLDLLFLINFSMDVLALAVSASILHRTLRWLRLLTAGAVGGVYACAALFLPVSGLLALAVDILVCFLLGAIAFATREKKNGLVTCVLTFTAVSMALGGIMTALFSLLNRMELPLGMDGGDGDGISVLLFALLAAIGGILTLAGGRFFSKRASKQTVTVEVTVGSRSQRLSALVDSGNLLCEPAGGRPCVVAEPSALSAILPPSLLDVVRNRRYDGIASVEGIRGICLVPVRTASGEGLLIAFRPTRMAVKTEKETHEVDAYLALCELGDSAMGHQALLPNVLVA